MSDFRKDLVAILILVGVTVCFFFEAIFSEKNVVFGEAFRVFYPLRQFMAEEFRQGRIPLWNPGPFAGESFLTHWQAALFYPFHLFFLLPGTASVFVSLMISHYFIAALCMYFLMRRLKCRSLTALIAGLAFGFSGSLVSMLPRVHWLNGFVWLPLILLQFHFALKRKDDRLAVLAGLFLAIQFFSGHWPAVAGTLIILFFWVVWVHEGKLQCLRQSLILVFVFLAVSMIQFLPVSEQFFSQPPLFRFSMPKAAFSPWRFLEFFFPHLFGLPFESEGFWGRKSWGFGVFIGVIPFCLAALSWFARHNVYVKFFAFMGLVSCGFALFFESAFFFFYMTFALAGLAGFGMEAFLRICEETEIEDAKAMRGYRNFIYAMMVLTGLLWCTLVAGVMNRNAISNLLSQWSGLEPGLVFPQVFKSVFFGTSLLTATAILLYKRIQVRGETIFFAALVTLLVIWEITQVNSRLIDWQPLSHFVGKSQIHAAFPQSLDEKKLDRLVYRVREVKSSEQWMKGVGEGLFDDTQEAGVIGPLAEKISFPQSPLLSQTHHTELIIRESDRVGFRVETSSPAIFILNEAYAPGWVVYVDGVRKPLLRVNEGMRGVVVHRGIQRVDFCFQPWSFRFGKYLTFASLVAFAIYFLHPFTFKTLLRAFSLAGLRRH